MGRTYAVAWKGNAGRAELSERGLELSARGLTELIPFSGIARLALTRGVLQIDALALRSLDGPGALRELADRVAARVPREPGTENLVPV